MNRSDPSGAVANGTPRNASIGSIEEEEDDVDGNVDCDVEEPDPTLLLDEEDEDDEDDEEEDEDEDCGDDEILLLRTLKDEVAVEEGDGNSDEEDDEDEEIDGDDEDLGGVIKIPLKNPYFVLI